MVPYNINNHQLQNGIYFFSTLYIYFVKTLEVQFWEKNGLMEEVMDVP